VQSQASRLEAVTLADIQAVAQKYLDIKRSVTGELLSAHKAIASDTPTGAPAPFSGTIH
jgi:predicted Zn-dependent peptidase